MLHGIWKHNDGINFRIMCSMDRRCKKVIGSCLSKADGTWFVTFVATLYFTVARGTALVPCGGCN